jgi:hypothetical protein
MSKEYVKALKRTSPNGAVSYEIEHEGERVRLGFTAAVAQGESRSLRAMG